MNGSSAPAADASLTSLAHDEVKTSDIAIGVIIGRTSEFFDFFVYAIASVIVFPSLMFPKETPLNGTLYSFAIFALAFIARPIGTVIFMAIDRAYGRGTKLTIALFLLGTSTVSVGFLSGYNTIGIWAVVLLALTRFGQGLAMGATWDGLASLLALNAPKGRRGWYAMIPQLGAPIGLILASTLFAFFVANLSSEDFISWGWRYPFFVAFAINVVALFARLRLVVTPAYVRYFESRELHPQSIASTLATQKQTIVVGAVAPLASFALFHMVTLFPLSWVYLFTKETSQRFLIIEVLAAVVGTGAIIVSGLVADRIGRRRLLGYTAVAIAVFSGFAPQLLSQGDLGEITYMVSGFIILGLSFGQSSGAVAANFPSAYRYTGSALIADLAWLFGAGFAPLIALYVSSRFGLLLAGLYLLSGATCTIIALYYNRRSSPNYEPS